MNKNITSVSIIIAAVCGILFGIIHFLSIEKHKNEQDRWLNKKIKAHKEQKICRRYIKVPRRDIYEGY